MATFFVTFPRRRRGPSRRDVAAAIERTIRQFPELLDYYIKLKEDTGDEAKAVSRDKVDEVKAIFVKQLQRAVEDIEQKSTFYEKSWTSYDEALERAREFKHYVEHQDGYRVINRNGQPFSSEAEVQLFFGLIWCRNRVRRQS